ncbi:MAG: hypothetical protein WCT39_03180 [Candidatus Margulisiibacteriota bacterium]
METNTNVAVFGYGEDSLTLWALKNKLNEILAGLGVDVKFSECHILYRPSFGRGQRGCGEPDFMLLTPKKIYIGESKWPISEKTCSGRAACFRLKESQIRSRLKIKACIECGLKNRVSGKLDWPKFQKKMRGRFKIPEEGSIWWKNFTAIMGIIPPGHVPEIENILLVFCDTEHPENTQEKLNKPDRFTKSREFKVIRLNHKEAFFKNHVFIRI